MFHPGRVLEVFPSKHKEINSGNASTQVMLDMWDENLITVVVDPKLAAKIKKDDVVLVDYTPMQDKPGPTLSVTKILKGAIAKNTWSTYKDHHKKKKGGGKNIVQIPQGIHIEQPAQAQAYVG